MRGVRAWQLVWHAAQVAEDVRTAEGSVDPDYQSGKDVAAVIAGTIVTASVLAEVLDVASMAVGFRLLTRLARRPLAAGAVAGGATRVARHSSSKVAPRVAVAQKCPKVPLFNIGGTGTRYGVISSGPSGLRVLEGARQGGGLSHADAAVQTWGRLAEGERRLGINFMGDDLYVTRSATSHIPRASEFQMYRDAIAGSGIQFAKAYVELDRQWVPLW